LESINNAKNSQQIEIWELGDSREITIIDLDWIEKWKRKKKKKNIYIYICFKLI